jgi:SAM-dependent methyltransferase
MINNLPLDDIIEWDVDNWGELIRLWTPIIESLPQGSRVLAIGERNGGLSTWLALHGLKVWCTDRVYPTELAIANHKKYGVTANITYSKFDVVEGDESFHNQFDLVIAKSVIGGLKRVYSDRNTRNFTVQQQAVDNIYKCLKKGGYFLSAENLEGGLPRRLIHKFTGRDRGWRYLSWKELPQLFSSFKIIKTKAFGVIPGKVKAKQLRRAIYAVNRYVFGLLPPAYKYIGFVVAKKP